MTPARTLYILFGMVYMFCISSLLAQHTYQEKKYGYLEGLPSERILSTFGNSKGFLFVHTQRGISIFDGYRFLSHPDLTGQIYSYYQQDDTLFYENTQALYKLRIDELHHRSTLVKSKNFYDSDPNNDHFQGLFVDSKQRIWCHDYEHIKYISPDRTVKTFKLFPLNKELYADLSFLEPTPGHLLILTPQGIYQWEEQAEQVTPVTASQQWPIEKVISPTNSRQLLVSTHVHALLLREKTLDLFHTIPTFATNTIKGFKQPNNAMLLYSKHDLWTLELHSEQPKKIFHSAEPILHVYQDPHTNLTWLSTQNGLVKLSKIKEGIKTILTPSSSTAPSPTVSIVEWKDTIVFLNTQGEIWKWTDDTVKRIYKHPIPNDLSSLNVAGEALLLTAHNAIYKLSENRLTLLPLKNLPQGKSAKKILLTPQNELWILFGKEKIKVYKADSFEEVTHRFENPESFWEDNLWNDLLLNHDGRIWLSGWMPKSFGINYYDAAQNRFIDVSDKTINPSSHVFVGDYYNRSATAYSKHELLFSAYGGWNRLDSKGTVLQKNNPDCYEFEDHYLVGIAEDRQENVFVATGEGLLVYLKKQDKNIHLSKADGLPADKLVYASLGLQNTLFLLGIDNGFVMIDQEKILKTALTNKMELTQIMVNGKRIFPPSSQIELNKDENNLALFFSNLSFLEPNKVTYRYRFDQDTWIELGHNPELILSHLAPGHYNLEVACTDNLSNTQVQTLTIAVIVHPPFVQSYPFYLLLALSGLLIVWGIYRFLLQKQRKEEKYKRDIKDREMQTLRAQMNPHFMFNTLNALNSFIIQNDTKNASRYLTSFSKLMRNILENSKLSLILLKKEIETLRLYIELESARLDNFFDYQIVVDPKVNPDTTLIPPTILQPFVENAIWHGIMHRENGFISIHLVQQDTETLRIEIEDNGVGRAYSQQLKKNRTLAHKSFGIQLTLERLKLINPENKIELIDLIDEFENGTGTKVVITIKTSFAHESDPH